MTRRAALALALLLSACNAADRISRIGAEPPMSAIENPAPIAAPHQLVMPMPPPSEAARQANSLWRTGNRTFFKDQRASTIGDILTVVVKEVSKVKQEDKVDRQTTTDLAAKLVRRHPHVFSAESTVYDPGEDYGIYTNFAVGTCGRATAGCTGAAAGIGCVCSGAECTAVGCCG